MSDSLLAPTWSGTPVATTTSDSAVLREFFAVEAAWLAALASQGFDTASLATALRALEGDAPSPETLAAEAWKAGNPVVGFVDHVRTQLEASTSTSLFHRGLTSQDVLDTALMAMAASVLEDLLRDLVRQGDRLAELATTHRDTRALATTLTRDAEVTVWGVRLAHWLESITAAHHRITRVRSELPIQRGGAVGDAKALAELLMENTAADSVVHTAEKIYDHCAKELGLVNPGRSWHTDRAPVLGLVWGLAQAGTAMATIARNIIELGRPGRGEVQGVSAEGIGGSSAMAHKQNPIRPILVNSAGTRIPGLVAQVLASSITVDERGEGGWNAEWEPVRDVLRLVGGQAHHLAETLTTLHIDTVAATTSLENSSVPHKYVSPETAAFLGATIDQAIAAWQEERA